MAESVVGLYKNESVKIDGPFKTVDELELATLVWMHWFNEHRLHSSIGYLTPIEAEQQYREMNPRQQPLSGERALHYLDSKGRCNTDRLWCAANGVTPTTNDSNLPSSLVGKNNRSV